MALSMTIGDALGKADLDELRKKLGLSEKTALVDMGKGQVETVTAGWTDAQIKAKALSQIDDLILQSEKAISKLQYTLDVERERKLGLQQVRDRKLKIGV